MGKKSTKSNTVSNTKSSTSSKTRKRVKRSKRPRIQRFLTYEQAKEWLEKYAKPFPTTRKEYWDWHDANRPGFLPKRPDKVYKEFSWNLFLGTTNSFEKTVMRNRGLGKKEYRDYWSACRWSQVFCKERGIKTGSEWKEYVKGNQLPDDIPKWPSHEYEEFSWFAWLGKNVNVVLDVQKNAVGVVGIYRIDGMASNCIDVKVWKGGVGDVRNDSIGNIYQLWEIEEGTLSVIDRALGMYGSKRDIGYIVPNINELLWYLNMEVQLKMIKL